ncbi:synaptonemal complex central element protein 1-like isoform X2 [Lemur catta]|uniref:synaptonemal complex central element protein 1-like isoform X2 n=1 Tax=Lemur catta TaxID=9447 RepID=UPI001E2678E9|nr:synaptonemal complex central element protein 1-like isoform X2 [Lemur catta]
MAGKLEPLNVESPEAAEEAEEGSLEPQIEDLINRINKIQQVKKKSSEELEETQALLESLHRELDSLNGEKVHLEEILSKKKEALRILQLQEKKSEAQRESTGQGFGGLCMRSPRHGWAGCWSFHPWVSTPRLDVEEQLEDLMGQHKDLWEFHVLERRLAREIRALERSKEQLLAERKLVGAKLQDAERRLRSLPEVEGARAGKDGLKAGLRKRGEQVQGGPEAGAGREARPELLCAGDREDLEPPPAGPDAP